MTGLCSYCSRYFICSKRPKPSEENVKLCSSFTQNNDNEETIWEQRRYEIARKLFFINKEQLELLIDGLMAANVLIHNEVDLSQFIHQGK